MHLYKMTKTISETVQSRSNYSEATCTVVTVAFPNILVHYWLCKKVRSYTLFRGPVHLIIKCSTAKNSKIFLNLSTATVCANQVFIGLPMWKALASANKLCAIASIWQVQSEGGAKSVLRSCDHFLNCLCGPRHSSLVARSPR